MNSELINSEIELKIIMTMYQSFILISGAFLCILILTAFVNCGFDSLVHT
jgi:hypothetical protein